MAITKKGAEWEKKNSLFLIWAFFPLLDCIPFFHMNSRIKNKKWLAMGLAIAFLSLIAYMGAMFIPNLMYETAPEAPSYYDVAGPYPSEVDFMNEDQLTKYYDNPDYMFSTEFKISKEYKEYEKALDEYNQAQKEWESQPQIAAQIDRQYNYLSMMEGIAMGCVVVAFIIYVSAIVSVFLERPKYLRMLEKVENKNDIESMMSAGRNNNFRQMNNQNQFNSAANMSNFSNATNITNSSNVTNPANVTNGSKQLDINSASEEQLAELQGLTIIDAKKAVAYREAHGGFTSVDEFFSCINAKPHVIVKNENLIFVGLNEKNKSQSAPSVKRRLDL